MVHSGSRGLGESTLRAHTDKYKSSGFHIDHPGFKEYLYTHDYCIKWATCNRELIAKKISDLVGAKFERKLDVTHNMISKTVVNNKTHYLHRKGVAPSDEGLVMTAITNLEEKRCFTSNMSI